jgi:hypothetical protein
VENEAFGRWYFLKTENEENEFINLNRGGFGRVAPPTIKAVYDAEFDRVTAKSKFELAISRIEHLRLNGTEKDKLWLRFAFKKSKFQGVVHCETLLASEHLQSKLASNSQSSWSTSCCTADSTENRVDGYEAIQFMDTMKDQETTYADVLAERLPIVLIILLGLKQDQRIFPIVEAGLTDGSLPFKADALDLIFGLKSLGVRQVFESLQTS